jgi:hypothetical protein
VRLLAQAVGAPLGGGRTQATAEATRHEEQAMRQETRLRGQRLLLYPYPFVLVPHPTHSVIDHTGHLMGEARSGEDPPD